MSRPPADLPERLLQSDATDFERRVLEAALDRKPSSAASSRMAKALGVSAMTIGTATAKTVAAGAAAAKVTATAGASVVWPWVSIGVLGLAVAGAVVGVRASHEAHERPAAPPRVTASPQPEPAPQAPTPPAEVVTAPPPRAVAASPRNRAPAAAADLADQVALIDSARAAMSAGAGARALEILRRYEGKYTSGSFRPEAAAIRIEALMKLGREAEARALAERFVAEHPGSLLARRVADVVGLEER
jgi:hypothetical protein